MRHLFGEGEAREMDILAIQEADTNPFTTETTIHTRTLDPAMSPRNSSGFKTMIRSRPISLPWHIARRATLLVAPPAILPGWFNIAKPAIFLHCLPMTLSIQSCGPKRFMNHPPSYNQAIPMPWPVQPRKLSPNLMNLHQLADSPSLWPS